MSARHVHDLLGVGIGPFNLGLAALSAPLTDLDAVFLDAKPAFDWHPGMMIEGATIQVPFLADLVTLADPTSPYSFLNHLKRTGRLYPFYIRESFTPLRAEYRDYGRWVAEQLASLHWGRTVTAVHDEDGVYRVTAATADGTETWWARRLVLGVGTRPALPAALAGLPPETERSGGTGAPRVVHSADYLPHRDAIRRARSVTVLGSGQSAAEIYRDLLDGARPQGYRLDWITRSPRFFPMEYTKLSLELTSPEYTDYLHALPAVTRDRVNREQRSLYKGISSGLVDDIHEALYQRLATGDPATTRLLTNTALETAARTEDGALRLGLHQHEQDRRFETETDVLVVATGYHAGVPAFLDPVRHQLRLDDRGRYAVARDHTVDVDDARIWVQNAEEHTHGLTAPDLGMGAHRNARILRGVLGREVYPVEDRIAFQQFGAGPASLAAPDVPMPHHHPSPVGVLTLEPVDPGAHAGLLHSWYTHPRSVFWGLGDATVADVLAEHRRIDVDPHHHAWLGRLDGVPLFVAESYDPAHSPLADHYAVRDGDIGMHVLVAPPGLSASPGGVRHGTTAAVFDAVLGFLFADPRVQRVVVEPDVRNEAVAARNAAAGFTESGLVTLPDKTARLSLCTRAAHRRSTTDPFPTSRQEVPA